MQKSLDIDALYQHFVASDYQVCTDSRNINSGDVFFCLQGDKFDGNAYAQEALNKGCRAVIVDHAIFKNNDSFIWVPDTTLALQALAKHHAAQMPCTKIMVGGSNGKTTTKEVTKTVLESMGATLATPGNWNNHIGVPLTLLQIRPFHAFAIIEMGTNHPGEMAILCDLVAPNIGLITNIGKEHLEGFGNIEAVAKEESEVYSSVITHRALGIVNIDDVWLQSMSKRLRDKISISTHDIGASFYAHITTEMPQLVFDFYCGGDHIGQFSSPLSGRYNAYNLLFGVSIAHHFGMDVAMAMKTACQYKPNNNRSEWRIVNGKSLFLDAYNANPSSMAFALQSFATIPGSKAFFLGDMLELGEHSEAEHQAILSLCKNLDIINQTHLVGNHFDESCVDHPYRFTTIDTLLAWLDTHPIEADFVFIKGSRGLKMERLIEHFE